MSQISDLLDKNKPLYIPARLEATALVLEELIKILSPEQREKLNESLLAHFPSVENASGSDPYTIDYQLSLFIKK